MAAEPSGARAPSRGQQRRGRVLAFKVLYEVDVSGHNAADVLTRAAAEQPPDTAPFEYGTHLVRGVARRRREIDRMIRRYAPAWPLAQMAATDRTILRIGIFEVIENSTTIPVAVAISDAVALAKRFGSESSSRFVNGVLGRVAAELNRSEAGQSSGDRSPARPSPDRAGGIRIARPEEFAHGNG